MYYLLSLLFDIHIALAVWSTAGKETQPARGHSLERLVRSGHSQAFFCQTCHHVPLCLLVAQTSSSSVPSSSQSPYQQVLGPGFSLGRDSWWVREGVVQSLFWDQQAIRKLLRELVVLPLFFVLHWTPPTEEKGCSSDRSCSQGWRWRRNGASSLLW